MSARLLERDVISGAALDGVVFDVPVRRVRLQKFLREHGPLRLAEGPDPAALTCEIWTVTNGRAMPGGLDPHEIMSRWSGLAFGLTGAVWGGGSRLAPANASRASRDSVLDGVRSGFRRARAVGLERGLRASRTTALGPYHELMIGVPNVCIGSEPTRYVAILGMVTDSPISRAIDRWFDYGYDKRIGHFNREHDGVVEVRVNDRRILSAEFSLVGNRNGPQPLATLDERWSQPFLGGLQDGRLRASSLERRIGADSPCVRIRGSVELSWPPIAGLVPARRALLPERGRGSWAAAFTGVASRIGRPVLVGTRT